MRKRTAKKAGIGSAFDDFLKDEGTYEATQGLAIKRVLAWQIEEAMKKRRLTKAEMARRMETSRSQLDRLLDPDSASVTLETLTRAARAIGRQVKLELACKPDCFSAGIGRMHFIIPGIESRFNEAQHA